LHAGALARDLRATRASARRADPGGARGCQEQDVTRAIRKFLMARGQYKRKSFLMATKRSRSDCHERAISVDDSPLSICSRRTDEPARQSIGIFSNSYS